MYLRATQLPPADRKRKTRLFGKWIEVMTGNGEPNFAFQSPWYYPPGFLHLKSRFIRLFAKDLLRIWLMYSKKCLGWLLIIWSSSQFICKIGSILLPQNWFTKDTSVTYPSPSDILYRAIALNGMCFLHGFHRSWDSSRQPHDLCSHIVLLMSFWQWYREVLGSRSGCCSSCILVLLRIMSLPDSFAKAHPYEDIVKLNPKLN